MSQTWSFWSRSPAEVLQQLETVPQGLFGDEACRPPSARCASSLVTEEPAVYLRAAVSAIHHPIILILLAAAGLAFFLADPTDTAIILMIVP